MSFISVPFAILFSVFLALMAVVRGDMGRRVLLLAVSGVFYAWFDWRFLFLLATITAVDYSIAGILHRSRHARNRKLLLAASVALNLGLLFTFKYLGFFLYHLNRLAGLFGGRVEVIELTIPNGHPFYPFETSSYVIDVYRRATPPARSLLDYAVFITFFPRLVAGPIMRAQQFLPQIERRITLSIENASAGMQIFAMGALKKMVVADTVAIFVDRVYQSPQVFSPATVWLAIFAYSIQIYCDFSGYTDMATGIARILGIELPVNFARPYTAQSITEFWRRWHISLSTWLRDYLYIPLGGSRRAPARTTANLVLTMLLGGLWHGAGLNFVVWGALHGIYLAVEQRLWSKPEPSPWTSARAWLRMAACFVVVSGTWVFFRSKSWGTTYRIGMKLTFLDSAGMVWIYWPAVLAMAAFLLVRAGRRYRMAMPPYPASDPRVAAFLAFSIVAILLLAPLDITPFIYFQF